VFFLWIFLWDFLRLGRGLDGGRRRRKTNSAVARSDRLCPRRRVHKTAVNKSVTAVTGLTEPARLLKPSGNRPLTVSTKPSFSANRSVYQSGFVEFENRHCSCFLNLSLFYPSSKPSYKCGPHKPFVLFLLVNHRVRFLPSRTPRNLMPPST
jgi:hypothetical protein